MDSIEEARRTIGPELVDATQLHAWAELRAAQDKFPELIRRLLDATPGITNVSVRTAEGVALQGWDGRAESDGKGPLPEGALIIELGVGKQPKKQKADDDFEKRKAELGSGATDYVFVFVTARRWGNGATWAATRREEQIFRNVVVLDADDVEGWLQRCPDVHHWLSELLGRRPHEAETLGRWWERFRRQTDPELPIELFGAGRQAEAARLAAQLRGDPAQVTVRTGWRDDALAFIHYVASQLSEQLEEPLTVASAQVWERAVRRPGHMTLVPLFDQPDIATALQQGHHVILIAAASEHVRGEKLELSRPQRDVAAEALRAAGIEFDKAYRLAGLARRSMPAMVRELARDGRIIDPPWADPPSVTVLAPAMLAGSWSVTASDTSALERLVGKDWTDIERVLSH